MDFASLMKAQISKGKDNNPTQSTQKYLKRSEVEQQREDKYLAEQAAREKERLEKAEKKRKYEEEEAEKVKVREEKRRRLAEESKARREQEEAEEERKRRKRLGLPEIAPKSTSEEDGDEIRPDEDIPEEELCAKLKDLGEQEQVDGESHMQRLRRYWRLIGHERPRSATPSKKIYPGPIPTSLEPVPGGEMPVPQKPPADEAGKRYLARQLTSYFSMILREWNSAMDDRSDDVKESYAGKAAYNAMTQAREHLRPLFRRLEKNELPPDLLDPITNIVYLAQARRYVDANDGYLKLSIGKAAWPIGVTMVGIHERSAREKLHDGSGGDKTAHIMSDEGTRKFLQAIKRCLSFAQTRWPPEDMRQLMG